ncbi:flavodoxin [Eubacterium callanderi]|uniref:Flavodoxin n=1 Tax=Eubacterium limosum TaxID=1736 RepID=A0A6N3G2V6_EUBLI|nr:flavodoxin [Eubacterium callanderi]
MKKRIFSLLMSGLLVLGLTACGTTQESPTNENTESSAGTDSEQTVDGKSLVVYFSMPETTNPENMNAEEEYSTVVIDGEVLGNTQYVAYVIQENTGADIFRIEPVTPYPMDHGELEEVATEEKRNNAMPEITAEVENLEQYDTIFLWYPNWYADMPRIIYSFLEQYDLSGKTIVPFVTSGGSGFSNTIQTIAEQEPDATVVTDGLYISRTEVQDAEQEIIQWVNELGYSK